MGQRELINWLTEQPFFISQINNVVISSVLKQFKAVEPVEALREMVHDWNHLLFCASLLTHSDFEDHQDIALRIAQHCLNDNSCRQHQKDAAAIILDCLGNRIALELAERRNLLPRGIDDRIPVPLRMDWAFRAMEYSLALSQDKVLHVNKFQRSFWDAVTENEWIALSAPTSAGKSFILANWLSKFARTGQNATVIYLVPTRALVQQVEEDLTASFAENKLSASINVSSVPLPSSIKSGKSNVLVFTQERLHLLFASMNYDVTIDCLIVDEAQKLGDGYRGILLQDVIETTVAINPRTKLIFAAPMVDNIESLVASKESSRRSRSVCDNSPMVNQNLLWVSHVPGKHKEWNLSLVLDGEPKQIGRFKLQFGPTSSSKRVCFVAFALSGDEGGNLIYVNGAADAERLAKQLYGLLPPLLPEQREQVEGLILLSKTIVHGEYLLGTVASRGIAFHYGNMPLLLKSEIERLFRANIIKYLICTSTLLEGVNLPCRNVFVRGPRKGKSTPMRDADFWNLAGRAGRWGKEFQGNIICIDPQDRNVWRAPAPKTKRKYRIQRTSDEVFRNYGELIQFISDGTPRTVAMERPELEYSVSYLVSSQVRFGSINHTPWANSLPQEAIGMLQPAIERLCSNLSLPPEIAARNPGISPLAMEELLTHFRNEKGGPEKFVPIPAESDEAVVHYTILLSRINKTLGPIFGPAKRTYALGMLITNWLKGYPLSRLITERLNYLRRNNRTVSIAKVIRETMADVEEIARFQAPKYIGCYIDVLTFHLKSLNQEHLLTSVNDIALRLEYGISNTTQLSLIGLGLSRTTAIAISDIIPDDALNEVSCLHWLKTNQQLYGDLPSVIRSEIAKAIHSHGGHS